MSRKQYFPDPTGCMHTELHDYDSIYKTFNTQARQNSSTEEGKEGGTKPYHQLGDEEGIFVNDVTKHQDRSHSKMSQATQIGFDDEGRNLKLGGNGYQGERWQ